MNPGNMMTNPITQSTPLGNIQEGQEAVVIDDNNEEGENDKLDEDDEFHIPKRNKTSEAWEDFNEFEENGNYYAICRYCNKKLSRVNQSKQLACGGTETHVHLEKQV